MALVFLDTTDELLTKLVRSRYRKISSLAGLNRQVWSIKELLYGLYRSNFLMGTKQVRYAHLVC